MGLQTSPNDQLLWAMDNRGTVFVRTGLSEEMPVGTGWEMVPGGSLLTRALMVAALPWLPPPMAAGVCVFQG